MTRARDMANIAAGSFSIPSGSLTNAVPAAGSITNSMLASGAITSANLPAGTVLQVVQATSSTTLQTSTATTWHDLLPTVTITPNSSSSKVLITHTGAVMCYQTTASVMYRILRDTTEIVQIGRVYSSVGSGHWTGHMLAIEYLDSPSTTSATTYKIQLQFTSTSGQARHNNPTTGFTPKAITIAKEISG